MSLIAPEDYGVSAASAGVSGVPVLRTADQYHAWKTRVSNKCWAQTGIDVLLVSDDTCAKAMKADLEVKESDRLNWVGKCWLAITGSLHDDLLIKTSHVQRGHIASLLKEINAALLITSAEEIQPLRLEMYGASMQKDCASDLQTFIAYLLTRQKKLAFHKKPVEDDELIAIFLKGLHPVFQSLQVHFAIPGTLPDKFDAVVEIVRKFAATPVVAAELAKLKSNGISQHMFTVSTDATSNKPLCRQFASRGTCSYGSACKFVHKPNLAAAIDQNISSPQLKCAFCYEQGHVAVDCPTRLAQLAAIPQLAQTASPVVLTAFDNSDYKHSSNPESDQFAFLFSANPMHSIYNWVVDSGATSNCTPDESDCMNIQSCNIQVTTAAGNTITVKKMGTAVINAVNEQGFTQRVTLSNCLISPLFPHRLLSLNCFTRKGHTITFADNQVRISNAVNQVVLLADRDEDSQLLLLRQAVVPSVLLLTTQLYSEPVVHAAPYQIAPSPIAAPGQIAALSLAPPAPHQIAATQTALQTAPHQTAPDQIAPLQTAPHHIAPHQSAAHQVAYAAILHALQAAAAAPKRSRQNVHLSPNKRSRRDLAKKAKLPCTANLRRLRLLQPCFQLCADPSERTCCPPETCSRAGCI